MAKKASVKIKGNGYSISGDFHKIEKNLPIRDEGKKLCGVTNPRHMVYIHSYGGEAPFFEGLAKGKLLATRCDNPECEHKGTVYLPFRIYCADCLRKNTIVDVTDWARETGKIYSYIVTNRTGAFNVLEKPIRFIDVAIEGIATVLKSYQLVNDPDIALPVVPIFRTKHPTYTITDLAFVAKNTREDELPEGFSFGKK